MTDTTQTPRKSWNPFGSVFTILGILMGTASLISLIQRWTGVEIISEIARDALSLYRQMTEQLHWALFDWWTPVELPWGWVFAMPMWGMDLLAVWIVSGSALYRGVTARNSVLREQLNQNALPWHVRHPRVSFVFLAPVWPVIALLVIVIPVFARELSVRKQTAAYKEATAFDESIPVDTSRSEAEIDIARDLIIEKAKHAQLLSSSTGVLVVGVMAPVLLCVVFFLWNAIQITPQ